MAEQTESNPFDLARIRQLVRLMRENDLSEIDLKWQESRLRLRRGADNIYTSVVPSPVARPAAASAEPPSNDAAPAAKAIPASNLLTVTSPIVGTFYRSPSPEADPFVTIGAKISEDTIVCVIEAMKVFNEIPAKVTGTIREVLIENGAPVEYGQPLYRVEP